VAADGAFQSNTPTFSLPTGGWIQVTDHMLPGLLSGAVAFEALTYGTTTGAVHDVDNINVTGNLVVPKPATMTLLAGGAWRSFPAPPPSREVGGIRCVGQVSGAGGSDPMTAVVSSLKQMLRES